MTAVDALLFGRRTWQGMAAAWPERAGDPYADKMNAVKKYVASRTLTQDDLTWNTTLLSPDHAVADIAALRAQDGGDLMVWGSASLVTTLLAEGPMTSKSSAHGRNDDQQAWHSTVRRRAGAAVLRDQLRANEWDMLGAVGSGVA